MQRSCCPCRGAYALNYRTLGFPKPGGQEPHRPLPATATSSFHVLMRVAGPRTWRADASGSPCCCAPLRTTRPELAPRHKCSGGTRGYSRSAGPPLLFSLRRHINTRGHMGAETAQRPPCERHRNRFSAFLSASRSVYSPRTTAPYIILLRSPSLTPPHIDTPPTGDCLRR